MKKGNYVKRFYRLGATVFMVLSCFLPGLALAEDFSIIVLPDTQKYVAGYPQIFSSQTQWIVANKDSLNIAYVAHEGDIVDTANDSAQWDNAVAAISLLEDPVTTGLAEGIPYGVVPGNHDEGGYYNAYFGVARFCASYPTGCRSYYGDGYPLGFNDSNYTLFSAGGMDFIVINLDYYLPAAGVLAWADQLLQDYADRRAIVVSHSILGYPGGTPNNAPFTSWGQQIYEALKANPNLFLMLCGHNHAEAMRTDTYNGNTVYTLLADYQDLAAGGNGWLRILEFSPENDEIRVKTYSPWLDAYGTATDMGINTTSAEFTLAYEMSSSLAPGDLIISGLQSWNSFGEFIELFNTTDRTISLESLNLISRVAPAAGGTLAIDWQLADESPDLSGKSIAPHGFFLIAEPAVAAPGGLHDLETALNLATGEGGSAERAIGLELMIDGRHLDHVLYGRHDGSDAENPPGDLLFDGLSFPRDEVIRNTRGTGSFQEGLLRRASSRDLYAGHAVAGFYADEGALADGNPSGVWSSPHDETFAGYEARNSRSAAVLPPAPGLCDDFEAYLPGQNIGSYPGWFDGGSGPLVTGGNGVASSIGLAPGSAIFTWTAQPFYWTAPEFEGINLQMDFQTNGSGLLDDDRVGWMIHDDSNGSDYIFGVQVDPEGGNLRLEGYWDHVINVDEDKRPVLGEVAGALAADTWYRLRAEITRLTLTSATISASLIELDGAGDPVAGEPVLSGVIADTSSLGADSPDPGYFADTLWPAYKNYTAAGAAADNACFELVQPAGPLPTNTAPVATNAAISGTPEVGALLTGNYDYFDADSDQEGSSTFRWRRDGLEIGGATAATYALSAADEGAIITFEVTPIARTGEETGTPVVSPGVGPIVAPPSYEGAWEGFGNAADFPAGSSIGDHPHWFTTGSSPVLIGAGNGVAGSPGLTSGNQIFTWTGQEFNWNDPDLIAVEFEIDFQTDSSGNFDDDRAGWMITDSNTSSDLIFGVQLDPGGSGASGQNIEAYWDGDLFGDNGGRTSIAALPELPANAWYRLRGQFSKLTPTSAMIEVTLTELDGLGSEVGVVASGSIPDTAQLPDTAGEEIPNSGYFTPTRMWPAFKNYNCAGCDGAADNVHFGILYRTAAAGWTAYNDCVYDAATNSYLGDHVTTYGIGTGFTGATSGELLDQTTGASTGVTATITQSGGVVWQPSPTSGGADTAVGTDAYNTFGGLADMTGVIYYGSSGWYTDLTFTGLDPARTYAFATSASRANSSYSNRTSIYTISSVEAATNASTLGTQEYLGEPWSVAFNTGDNHNEGYVARWTGIEPGADGSFTVRATHHPGAESGYKAYAFDVFMLQVEGGALPVNTAPRASNVAISGSPAVGQVLTGNYDYYDADGDSQGTSTFRWLRDGTPISGAGATSYLLVAADQGAVITFEVTPVALTGESPGNPAVSAGVGPVGPPPSYGGLLEDFENDFTVGQVIGGSPDWYDEGDGPVVTSGNGVGGSIGLAPANQICTWSAQCVGGWQSADFQGAQLQMDFQTDGRGLFDDDRLGLMTAADSVSSADIFGVQLDHSDGGIVTYWRDSGGTRIQDVIVDLPNPLPSYAWFRFSAVITKLTDSSARIEVSLVALDGGGTPTGTPFSGVVEDTSQWAGGTPVADYFTSPTLCPAYKNYNCTGCDGAADNAGVNFLAAIRFAAIGDYGNYPSSNELAVADLVSGFTPGFIVTTGDNSYNSTPIDNNIGYYFSDYIGNYQGAFGPGSIENRFFPSLGNHDYTDGAGFAAFENYFSLPGAGIAGSNTSGSERYYDFIQGPVHFFVIDSNPAGLGGMAPGDGRSASSAQAVWLQARLAASTAPWKIVYMHHPPYSSSSSHGSEAVMQWPFEAWGATAVLAGHDHTYERITRDDNGDGVDFPYITTGAGGKSLYNFPSSGFVAGSQVRCGSGGASNGTVSDCYGALIVDATSRGLTFEYWSVENGGTLVDSYTMGSPSGPPPMTTTTVSFQEGLNGYGGTVDTYLMEAEPAAVHGGLGSVEWDTDDPSGTGQDKFALIRFDGIFGAAAGQIPVGANIQSATLTYGVYNTGHFANLHEAAVAWSANETYNSFGGEPGVQANEYGVSLGTAEGASAGAQVIDVTGSLAVWANNPSANRGWIFLPTGTDGVDFRASEYGVIAERPRLTVKYTPGGPPPEPGARVNQGLVVYYPFNEQQGTLVSDQSNDGVPMNLSISGAAAWQGEGIELNGGRIGTVGPATKVINALKASGGSSFELWLTPGNLSQSGPARMISIGADASSQCYVLGQSGDELEVRLMHTGKDLKCRPRLTTDDGVLTSGLTHLVHTYDGNTERLFVNGVQHPVTVPVSGLYSNWDDHDLFSLGNEASSDRPWRGTIYLAAVYDHALTGAEIAQNLAAGPSGVIPPAPDTDGDGIADSEDNCPGLANAAQADADRDELGDLCDACPADADNDGDHDGVCGNVDNCPAVANPGQADTDNDGIGDACECVDGDNDGVCDTVDNCPGLANPAQGDADGDELGDLCDACPDDAANDGDNDGVCGNVDNCPLIANPAQTDADGNGIGDACEVAASPRVTEGLVVYYPFSEQQGTLVSDQSRNGAPMNLAISGAVAWQGEGITLNGGRIGTSGAATKVINALKASSGSTFELWLTPGNLSQSGPARLISIGADASSQCYVLGQSGDELEVRLMHTGKDLKCRPRLTTDDGVLTSGLTHLVHTYDGNTERLFVNGVQHPVTVPVSGLYSNWDDHDLFSIGNEASSDRPWRGTVYLAAVYDHALTGAEIAQNLAAGPSGGVILPAPDTDGDGIADSVDNCPGLANAAQADADGDGLGDLCDACPADPANDGDHDGVCGNVDNCPEVANPGQADADGNGIGDACEVAASPRVTEGLVVYYPFSEQQGTLVSDQSRNGAPMNLAISGAVAWQGEGIALNGGRIGTGGAATKVINALKASGHSTFELWLAPGNLSQSGPARMISIGANALSQNYVLGQIGSDLEVRLMHTGKDSKSRPRLTTSNNFLTGGLTHIVHTYDGTTERLFVNGVQHPVTVTVSGLYSNWAAGDLFSLGNEASSDRPWRGTIYLVAVYDHALSEAEISQNLAAGPTNE